MSRPAYSILYSAPVAPSVTSGIRGQVLIPSESASDRGRYVVATLANRGTRRSTGVALANFTAGGSVEVQQSGELDAETSGLGTGAASWVRVSTTGYLERVTTPGDDDDVVGRAEADGRVRLMFGVITPSMANGGGSSTVADDIAKSTGSAIDRVEGLRGRPLASTAPSRGHAYGYNPTTGEWEPRKIASPGQFDVTAYGAVGDFDGSTGTDNLAAFEAALADMTVRDGGTLIIPPGRYYLSDNLVLDRPVIVRGASSVSFASVSTTILDFAPGKGVIIQGFRMSTEPRGEGSSLRDLSIICQPVPSIGTWDYSTAYAVGDKVFLPYSHRYYYECIQAGTSSARPAAAWQAATVYTAGDIVTPVAATGHRYYCTTGGTSDVTEPVWQLEYQEANTLADGTAEWREYGDFVAAPDIGLRPLFGTWPIRYNASGRLDPLIKYTAGQSYRTGDVVWVPGVSEVNDVVFVMLASDVRADATGISNPSWNTAYDATTVDGSLTWTAKQASAVGYFTTDGTAIWLCHVAAGVAFYQAGFVEHVCVLNATNAGYHLQGDATFWPPSNVNYWRLKDCSASSCGVTVYVKGYDSNGGYASGVSDFSANANYPNEWQEGIVDDSFVGGSWHGCRVENRYGPAFTALQPVADSSFVGCYAENNLKCRIYSATVVAGGGQMGGTLVKYNRISEGLVLSKGGVHNLSSVDDRVAGQRVITQLAGHRSTTQGIYHLSLFADGEAGYSGLANSQQLSAGGWTPGWYLMGYQPDVYSGGLSAFAFSGSQATAFRELAAGGVYPEGQMLIPRGDLFLGPVTNPRMVRSASAFPTTGNLYKAGDRIWNTAPTGAHDTEWVCVADAAGNNGGTWVSTGQPFDEHRVVAESVALAPGAGTESLAALVLPVGDCLITCVVRVQQWSETDPTKYGVWRRSRALRKTGGVITYLAAVADDVVAVNTGAFTAPGITDAGGSLVVQVAGIAGEDTRATVAAEYLVTEV